MPQPAESRPLACLVVAPSATAAALRQSEALFDMALRGVLREHDVAVRWARRLADPVGTPETAAQEVRSADFVLAEVSANDPVVLLYLGVANALDAPVVALRRGAGHASELVRRVASDLLEYELTSFGVSELAIKLKEILRHFEDVRRFSKRDEEERKSQPPSRDAMRVIEVERLLHAPPPPLDGVATEVSLDSDAGWKDLAFTATHSIANNLFPIEVYLGHLLEIGRREGLRDAATAAERALANLEKAKLQVERFKSLAAETALRPRRVDLLEAVVARVDYLERRGVKVSLFDDGAAAVLADPMMVDECLDELVTNAMTWLHGTAEARVSILLRPALRDDLPERLLAGAGDHLLLRFEDNGPGVAHEDKERIFDLFYSTNPQGKGIGLATIRKSMRRMGGEVRETGVPGNGARFEVFLPRFRDERQPGEGD